MCTIGWCVVIGRILLANLFQGSRSTLFCVSFPSVFAFQAGMWGTPISALLNSPTVSLRFAHPVFHPMVCYFKVLCACTTNRATLNVPPDLCYERFWHKPCG